jgi:hypothetical protein
MLARLEEAGTEGLRMSPALLFGLFVLGSGLFVWVIAGFVARRAATIRSWFAEVDIAWWTQRGKAQIHVLAFFWFLLGLGFCVYGLVAGR